MPAFVLMKLRKFNLLEQIGKPRLKPVVFALLHPDTDRMMGGLIKLLGADLSGPQICICDCQKCRPVEAGIDIQMNMQLSAEAALEEERRIERKRDSKSRDQRSD